MKRILLSLVAVFALTAFASRAIAEEPAPDAKPAKKKGGGKKKKDAEKKEEAPAK